MQPNDPREEFNESYWKRRHKATEEHRNMDSYTKKQYWKIVRDLLKGKNEIFGYKERQENYIRSQLKAFDKENGQPLPANALDQSLANAMLLDDSSDLDDWDKWKRRRVIIDGSGQRVREHCMALGNTREQCICVLETEKGQGLSQASCVMFFNDYIDPRTKQFKKL